MMKYNWTPEESNMLKEAGFLHYGSYATKYNRTITKEEWYSEVSFRLTLESQGRDIDGDVGPCWTHLRYNTLEEVLNKKI